MPTRDYSHGKIYKLCSDVDEYFYIGSTTNGLPQRLGRHRSDAIRAPDRRVYKHFNVIGLDNMKIILIEKCSVNDKAELLRCEDQHIRQHFNNALCLNIRKAVANPDDYKANKAEYDKIYRQDNKEYKDFYAEIYRENNRDQRLQYFKDRYEGNKEQILQKMVGYRERNSELIKERKKQYHIRNIDTIHERKREYYQQVKDRISEKNKATVHCLICNEDVTRINFKRHERSAKHQLNLQEVKTV